MDETIKNQLAEGTKAEELAREPWYRKWERFKEWIKEQKWPPLLKNSVLYRMKQIEETRE